MYLDSLKVTNTGEKKKDCNLMFIQRPRSVVLEDICFGLSTVEEVPKQQEQTTSKNLTRKSPAFKFLSKHNYRTNRQIAVKCTEIINGKSIHYAVKSYHVTEHMVIYY